MTQTTTETLKPKQHFEILDGLRGVAALAIVFFHFMEIVYPPNENFIAHGFLAVDFFFCLSGFVIAYAYNDRIEKMKLSDFFTLRPARRIETKYIKVTICHNRKRNQKNRSQKDQNQFTGFVGFRMTAKRIKKKSQ